LVRLIKEVVLISTADWDNPFWTNKQHIAKRLADRGYKVLYINSLGLRRPSSSSKDIGRMARRLKSFFGGLKQKHENLWVWSPVVIPYQKYAWVRKLNFFIVSQFIKRYKRKLGLSNYLTWTYNPLSAPLLNKGEQLSVYHCVDEISAQPGMPEQIIQDQELTLIKQSDIIFTTAMNLYESRKINNPHTYYSANVADYELFSKARLPETELPLDMISYTKPIVGFVGAINGYKLDLKLIRDVALQSPEYEFVLIGQVGEGDPWTDISLLEGVENIQLIGPRSYETLPGYIKAFDVCLLPNMINDYTINMFPMKFFEYLAAGKPIVMTSLPALQEYYGLGYVADNADAFAKAIKNAVNEKFDANYSQLLEQRLEEARKHDWEARIDTMIELIEQQLLLKEG
jgi:glycosyltransferase involved in cell wall biosynthesis